jgi:hypothetical protein
VPGKVRHAELLSGNKNPNFLNLAVHYVVVRKEATDMINKYDNTVVKQNISRKGQGNDSSY